MRCVIHVEDMAADTLFDQFGATTDSAKQHDLMKQVDMNFATAFLCCAAAVRLETSKVTTVIARFILPPR